MFQWALSMQFRKPCRKFSDKMQESFRSVFQNDRTKTTFSRKSSSKSSTENAELNYNYHDRKTGQKTMKRSLKFQKQRKSFSAEKFPMDHRMKFWQPCLKLYTVRPNVLLNTPNCWEKWYFLSKNLLNLNVLVRYTRRMQLEIWTEKYWKKAEKKLLNVQKCWNFFSRKPFFFFCSNGQEECKFDNVAECFSTESWKGFAHCPKSMNQKSNTSQISIFLQNGPLKT